jgi:hypothetical protein
MNTPALERLCAFRQAISTTFGCRRDALVESLDALLTTPVIEHPAHLSLAPGFQRTWGSVYDALNAGTMPLPRLEHLVTEPPLETTTAWYAVDASVWPRCDAETSPERGYYPHHSRHSTGQPIVAGWNYSWLVQLPERCSSWTAPLRVRRMQPGENVNQVAAEQIRSFLRHRPAGKPCPIFTFDAGYEAVQLGVALAGEEVGILVRLRSGRCFSADPPQGPTGGRPRRHGAKFICDDPTTWPAPTSQWSATDAQYGWVRIQCWSDLHAIPQRHAKRGTRQARPIVRGTLIRLEVEHLPKPDVCARAAVALVVGTRPAGSGHPLAGIRRSVLYRAHLSFLQAGAEVDNAKAALPRGRRSLDLVGDPCRRPTPPGSFPGR